MLYIIFSVIKPFSDPRVLCERGGATRTRPPPSEVKWRFGEVSVRSEMFAVRKTVVGINVF